MKLFLFILAIPLLCAQPEYPDRPGPGSRANQIPVKTYQLTIIRAGELGRPWFEPDPPRVEDVLSRIHRGDRVRVTNLLNRRTWNFTYKELRARYIKDPAAVLEVR